MSASFEHTAMKSSFSLSSLRSAPAPPGGHCEQLERPYHSLTKKRKEPCREAWRRSWGSTASGGSAGDDLWPLLQRHYDYIMDNQIIDSCKEANGELLSHNPSALLSGPCLLNPTSGFNRQWSLNQLVSEFDELCQWLTHVQEEIYSSPENLSNWKLRANRMAELVAVEPRRAKFVEQANAILERIPEANGEVTWRIEHLRIKWEALRLLLSPEQPHLDGENPDTVDTAHELRCLRRWLHSMEGRLPPPSLAAARSASHHELLRKLREHQNLPPDRKRDPLRRSGEKVSGLCLWVIYTPSPLLQATGSTRTMLGVHSGSEGSEMTCFGRRRLFTIWSAGSAMPAATMTVLLWGAALSKWG